MPNSEGWWAIYIATGIGVIICLVVLFVGMVIN